MVGNLTVEDEEKFGKILSEYMKDDRSLFIISSDFCHWGPNFGYFYYETK